MARYKISKKNVNEFFGLFGKKKKPKSVDDLIKSDTVLQKLDKEIEDINKRASKYIRRDKVTMDILKQYGIKID